MSPESRASSLYKFLGWQGGTIHDACAQIGVDVHEFLYSDFDQLCRTLERKMLDIFGNTS